MSKFNSSLDDPTVAAGEDPSTGVLFPVNSGGEYEGNRERPFAQGSRLGGTVDARPRTREGGTVDLRPRARLAIAKVSVPEPEPYVGSDVQGVKTSSPPGLMNDPPAIGSQVRDKSAGLSSRQRLGSMLCQSPLVSISKGLPAPSRKRRKSMTPSDSRTNPTPSDSGEVSSLPTVVPRNGKTKRKKSHSPLPLVPSSASPGEPAQKKKKKKKKSTTVGPSQASEAATAGSISDSCVDGQASQLLQLLHNAFEQCGLLPPSSTSAVAAGLPEHRTDRADNSHHTQEGASVDSHESTTLRSTRDTLPIRQTLPVSGNNSLTAGRLASRPMSRPRARTAPAALGAPPGEESFPWDDPPPQAAEQGFSDEEPFSDSQADLAPQPTANPAREARLLLQRYLPHSYPSTEAMDEEEESLIFARVPTPAKGIPLSRDFKAAYEMAASQASEASSRVKRPPVFGKGFNFLTEDHDAFFASKTFSPQLDRVGARIGTRFSGNQFAGIEKADIRYETHSRSALRLTAYLGALMGLRARASELDVTEDDCTLLDQSMLSLIGDLWMQLATAATMASNARRERVLSKLGIPPKDVSGFLPGVPQVGKHLFGGEAASLLKEEIEGRKQASELIRDLKASRPPVASVRKALPRMGPPIRPAAAPSQPRAPAQSGQRSRASSRGSGSRGGRHRSRRSSAKASAKPKQSV